jgi:hypothetical protein
MTFSLVLSLLFASATEAVPFSGEQVPTGTVTQVTMCKKVGTDFYGKCITLKSADTTVVFFMQGDVLIEIHRVDALGNREVFERYPLGK